MLKYEVVCHPVNHIFYQSVREDGERNHLKNKSYHTVWCYKRHKYKELWESEDSVTRVALWGGGQRSPDRWLALHQGLGELERNPASVNAQPCQREWSSQTVGSCPTSQALLSKLWEAAKALSGVRSLGCLAAPFKRHRV